MQAARGTTRLLAVGNRKVNVGDANGETNYWIDTKGKSDIAKADIE